MSSHNLRSRAGFGIKLKEDWVIRRLGVRLPSLLERFLHLPGVTVQRGEVKKQYLHLTLTAIQLLKLQSGIDIRVCGGSGRSRYAERQFGQNQQATAKWMYAFLDRSRVALR